jgi:ABC-type transporter lipoprotein component MlaA
MNTMRTALALVFAVLLSACASTPGRPYDPFEASNRVMYAINDPLDKYIAKPIAQAWVDYVPSIIRQGVSNYVNNIDDLFSGINGLLQGKLDKAGNDFGRVLINTGFGFAGLIDIASDAGIPRGEEDFGQTFGYWGIPQGPYLFIPLWGPTTVRDGTGIDPPPCLVADHLHPRRRRPQRDLWPGRRGPARFRARDDVADRTGVARSVYVRPARLPAASGVPGLRRQAAARKG